MVNMDRVRRLVRGRPELEGEFEGRHARLQQAARAVDEPMGYGGISVGPSIDLDRAREKLRRIAVVEANDDVLDEYLRVRMGLDRL